MSELLSQSNSGNRAEKISQFLVSRRNLLAGIGFVISVVLLTGLQYIGFDTSLGILLTEDDPYLDEYNVLEEKFPGRVTISFAFVPDNQQVFSPHTLSALQQLTAQFRQIPHAASISSLLNFQSPTDSLNLFTRRVETYSQAELAQLQQRALGNQFLTSTMLSPNADLTLATISLDQNANTAELRMEIAEAATALANELRGNYPQLKIHMNSEVLFEQSSKEAMLSDLSTLLPLVILVCILVVCVCFRSVFYAFCILGVASVAVLLTVSTVSWFGIAFNTVSVMAPLVVVIISTADSVHIVSIFLQEKKPGMSPAEAMKKSIDLNLRPIALASITTSIGFLSLKLSSAPGINDFGVIVAIGVGYAFLLTLVFLPALILWPAKMTHNIDSTRSFVMDKLIAKVIFLIDNHEKKLFWFFSALGVSTFLLLPLNQTDFNRLDFIASDSDLSDYYRVVDARMNRGALLSYGIDSQQVDGAIDPVFLNALDEFASALERLPEIENVASLVQVAKTINQMKHGSNDQYYAIRDTTDAVAQDLFDYQGVEREGFKLARFIDDDFSTVKLFISAIPMSNQQLIDMDQRINEQFSQSTLAMNTNSKLLHGSALLLFARMDESVTIELLQGYTLSLLLITITLMLGLKSIYYGFLSILPNLLPATIVFGFWGLFVGQIDPFVMMLFSISIGLVVDDTVHLLEKYLRYKDQGEDSKNAIQNSIRIAGPALIITTMLLAIGTCILIGASTLYFQQAARLLVPIVVLALVIDLLFLPTVLIRFDKRPPRVLNPQHTIKPEINQ